MWTFVLVGGSMMLMRYGASSSGDENESSNFTHQNIESYNLNQFRLKIINEINKKNEVRELYYRISKPILDVILGNELSMQSRVNLSIQLPNDESSLLPIHSDVWSGDSPYEINLWLPLVDCYRSKSMYLLKKKYLEKFILKLKKNKIKNSSKIFNLVKNEIILFQNPK